MSSAARVSTVWESETVRLSTVRVPLTIAEGERFRFVAQFFSGWLA
jgi:hypothetical protein